MSLPYLNDAPVRNERAPQGLAQADEFEQVIQRA
jgi:hypothetical protein